MRQVQVMTGIASAVSPIRAPTLTSPWRLCQCRVYDGGRVLMWSWASADSSNVRVASSSCIIVNITKVAGDFGR